MNSLSQYIDLYNDNKAVIEANSAPVLNRLRSRALEVVKNGRLPKKGDEGYEKTSIESMFAPDFGLNIARLNIPVDLAATFRCDVPNLSTWLGVTVNDDFHQVGDLATKLPEGVIFESFRKASEHHSDLLERYCGSIADLGNTRVALNSLLAQDGVLIYIPAGVKLEKPLQLVNIFSSPTPLMAARRVLIIAEAGSEAQMLVCDHTQDCERAYLSSEVVEIIVGENARFDYYDIEESSDLTSRCSNMFVKQHSGSSFVANGITLSCGSTRNDYDIDIPGNGCDTLLAGMAIGSSHRHIDNSSRVNHIGEHCSSNQIFKYVLDDEATGSFEGSINVNASARFTEAYQSNKNILASQGARMHTKPQLLIFCDDVKCSHGATTGQLSREALFYMQARGISEKTARTMLMEAFMADVIATVRMESLRDRLRHLVEKRFHGKESFCGNCGIGSADKKCK